MALFPGADKSIIKRFFTDKEIKWFAAFQWLLIVACILNLAWLLYNAVIILYKQEKYRVLPMANFYFLATLLVVFRLTFAVVWWLTLSKFLIFFTLFGQTLKFLIGF